MIDQKSVKKRQKQKSRQTSSKSPSSPMLQLLKASAISVLLSVLAAFAFIFIATFVSFKTSNPIKSIIPVGLIALYSAALLCGFISGKSYREHMIVNGLISSFVFMMFILLISLFIPSSAHPLVSSSKTLFFILLFPAVMAGSILSNVKMPKKHRRLSRRR